MMMRKKKGVGEEGGGWEERRGGKNDNSNSNDRLSTGPGGWGLRMQTAIIIFCLLGFIPVSYYCCYSRHDCY
jgi:hypothetical protein